MPSSIDRTASGTEPPATRFYPWLPTVTTFAILATILTLALTGNEVAAAATAGLGAAAGAVRVTVHIRR